MPTLLAIDLGTTFLKGAVLDLDTLSITHLHRVPFPDPVGGLPDLCCEIDVERVIDATRTLIRALLPNAPGCEGIIACGQMGGLVLADCDGAPLSNYISWRDQRLLMPHSSGAGTYWDRFAHVVDDTDRRQLGQEVRPGLPLSFLYWLRERGELPANAVTAASLPDFVLGHLCGARPATDSTNAVGAVNVESGDWHHSLFERLGLEQIGWPVLGDVHTVVGTLEIDGQRLTCYAPAGDHQTALAGAFIAPGELSINISTGSQASRLAARAAPGPYQIRPFFDGMFLNTITHIPAGRSLNVLLGLLGELAAAQGVSLADPWPAVTRAVAETPETDLAIDLAFFPGPLGERGAITHIHEGNLRIGHLFRAAYQAMAANYETCATRLSPARDWTRIVFSGGLAQHVDALRDLIVRRFQCEYRMCASSEDTLLGLLALGLAATGRAPSVQAAMRRLANLPAFR